MSLEIREFRRDDTGTVLALWEALVAEAEARLIRSAARGCSGGPLSDRRLEA